MDATADQVLSFFDSYWFDIQIITKKPPPPSPTIPDLETQGKPLKPVTSSRHVRSLNDLLVSETSFTSGSPSPKSVLHSYKLQTVYSGVKLNEEDQQSSTKVQEEDEKKHKHKQLTRSRSKKKGSSKSLSALEFEELKGFIDLGFVFSEEDRNSSLGSIIPGLHRLGKKDEHENKEVEIEKPEESLVVPRPYLSEAWDVMERQRKQQNSNPLMMMDWRIPAVSGEIDMKIHLKNWAHTVASTAAAVSTF